MPVQAGKWRAFVLEWIYNLVKTSFTENKEVSMFDSLDEQMKHDIEKQSTSTQRMLVWLAIVVAAVVLFGGLYFGVSRLS